jgi:hypothetical protein
MGCTSRTSRKTCNLEKYDKYVRLIANCYALNRQLLQNRSPWKNVVMLTMMIQNSGSKGNLFLM